MGSNRIATTPTSIEATGLTLGFLADLALKIIYRHGSLLGYQVADALKLPFTNVTEAVLDHLRREQLTEVKGSGTISEASYRHQITTKGRTQAREAMERSHYAGAAPVTLEDYAQVVRSQSVTDCLMTEDQLRQALSQLVLGEDLLDQLGPAVNSGRTMFLYGNTGNGKTSICQAIGQAMPGGIWIPYSVCIDDQIINIFDSLHHHVIAQETGPESSQGVLRYLPVKKDSNDQRWVLIQRPLIAVGGELTLKSLNLVYDPTLKYYEAPYQIKANGGVFLLDDFGRQRVRPHNLLNRWIVPLENRIDYLTLATGQKIDVPFDALVLFSTNLNPEDLMDEAFLRRIRHKVHVPDPTPAEFREIFSREAALHDIPFSNQGFQHLMSTHYTRARRTPRGVHPRDILDELLDIAKYRGISPTLSHELLDLACESYFLEQ